MITITNYINLKHI